MKQRASAFGGAGRLLGGLLVGSLNSASRQAAQDEKSAALARRRALERRAAERAAAGPAGDAPAAPTARDEVERAEANFHGELARRRREAGLLAATGNRGTTVFWVPRRTGDAARDAWLDAALEGRRAEVAEWERGARGELERAKREIAERHAQAGGGGPGAAMGEGRPRPASVSGSDAEEDRLDFGEDGDDGIARAATPPRSPPGAPATEEDRLALAEMEAAAEEARAKKRARFGRLGEAFGVGAGGGDRARPPGPGRLEAPRGRGGPGPRGPGGWGPQSGRGDAPRRVGGGATRPPPEGQGRKLRSVAVGGKRARDGSPEEGEV